MNNSIYNTRNYDVFMLDCTFRDGGYYNNWDFSKELTEIYLRTMRAISVDFVELGFRSLISDGFRGATAYTTDAFLDGLAIPSDITLGAMVNASELVKHRGGAIAAIRALFGERSQSKLGLIRIAAHFYEVEAALPACAALKEMGYRVGFNLMQIADRPLEEIKRLAHMVPGDVIDVLYFADSLGSLVPAQVDSIVAALRDGWDGALGIHTHDNCGLAMANVQAGVRAGISWIDSTVTGMGRGPGNAKTEYMAVEVSQMDGRSIDLIPLLELIHQHFGPMQRRYGWGTNTYYYLAGKLGIHPTYIQEMLMDARFGEAEILAAIDHLKSSGAKKFSIGNLEAARFFYSGPTKGGFEPRTLVAGREVLILGTGPGVTVHKDALARYIRNRKPFVIALNATSVIDEDLIDVRAACHSLRLLTDCAAHQALPQPLVCPMSMLPADVTTALAGKKVLDYGIGIDPAGFTFGSTACTLPAPLVFAYALAFATSGTADRIALAGFDGYPVEDPRNAEVERMMAQYLGTVGAVPITAITPTRLHVPRSSVYFFS